MTRRVWSLHVWSLIGHKQRFNCTEISCCDSLFVFPRLSFASLVGLASAGSEAFASASFVGLAFAPSEVVAFASPWYSLLPPDVLAFAAAPLVFAFCHVSRQGDRYSAVSVNEIVPDGKWQEINKPSAISYKP